jgi:predicted AAA+ superfamily ATPase
MATSNHERIGRLMELLRNGLKPFVEREYEARYGKNWGTEAAQVLRSERDWPGQNGDSPIDVQALLTLMQNRWMEVFANVLGRAERSYVGELREYRNQWAHQQAFSADDTYRAFDTAERLLLSISAPEAQEVGKQKHELARVRFEEQTRKELRKSSATPTEGQPKAGLRPWREIVTPHPDVAAGRYQQAEFAADLAQVHQGEGTDEYRDPAEFFRRTFVTDGLRRLLLSALLRLAGNGGDPVVELQTNFGGGKTHSMLALYHLFSGVRASDLAGVESVLRDADVSQPPEARRAVLVGTAISPGQPHRKADGTEIHTLWGELAYQIGGRDGYSLVAEADRRGASPGSDVLAQLFGTFYPCLILIDEWVAFVRQLYGVSGMPAGSFDANLTFAQALTEAARRSPQTLVVASIPSSDIEVGGEAGREALARIRNTFGRMESTWRPATSEESFEIVRRRLFQSVRDPDAFAARDAVARAFGELYRGQAGDFPTPCREVAYEQRIRDAYPIHPELFDRLYQDWSSLDKFQRTRGVLRLMAAVIYELWNRQDANLLILPGTVPMDAAPVRDELTRYMEDPWAPVIDKDVDGPYSLPLRLDGENPNLGRFSACRRVARSIYLGSAPTFHTAHRGLEDRQIRLGCVQPGEGVPIFGDALRRLSDQATHLYVDGKRYWLSTQPSLNRLAEDRALQQSEDAVIEEIEKRLREEGKTRGDFARVHACPPSGADVPDERDTRLVILRPEFCHSAKDQTSPARQEAQRILDQRGTSPRYNRNTLVFLASDRTRLNDLQSGVRQFLAWKSIEAEKETLNLDAYQRNQAKTKLESADQTVDKRVPETYLWLLAPGQSSPQDAIEWNEIRLQGQEPLAIRASKKLKVEEGLITNLGGIRLRLELDRIPLWQGDHVGVKQLADYFAQYLYLPRLKDSEVLLAAIREGAGRPLWEGETFAYADSYDTTRARYLGLRAGSDGSIVFDGLSVVVKSEAARHQLDLDAQPAPKPAPEAYPSSPDVAYRPIHDGGAPVTSQGPQTPSRSSPVRPHRFYGTVELDGTRLGRDAGQIAEAVTQHLAGLVGANVRVTLEIEADVLDGIPENVVRTVSENCRTLRFKVHEFEQQ